MAIAFSIYDLGDDPSAAGGVAAFSSVGGVAGRAPTEWPRAPRQPAAMRSSPLSWAGPRELPVESLRPRDGVVESDVADAADSGLHSLDVWQDALGRHGQLHAEHQLVALAAGLNLLGRELGLRGDETDLRPCRVFGGDVKDDAGVGADLDLHGVLGRQVDLHVHIAEVDEREDLAAAAQNLAFLGQSIEYAALERWSGESCR